MGDQLKTGEDRVVFWLGIMPSRVLGFVACILLFIMMLVTFIDVGGRYLFSSPLPAAYELISLIMPGIIFCALPNISLHESHVTIDLLDSFFSPGVKRWQSVFVNLFSAAAMGFIAYRLYVRYADHLRFQEVTDELFLPLWPFSLAMSVLSVVATLALLANAYGYLKNNPVHDDEDGVLSI